MFTLAIVIFTEFIKTLLKKMLGGRYSLFSHPSQRKYFSFCHPDLNLSKNQRSFAKISVVIPTHNGEKTLPKLLASLDKQENISLKEILIVDSHSTDRTITVAKSFPKVKIIQNTAPSFNHGLARNLGGKQASGKYILFTVQDACFNDQQLLSEMVAMIASDSRCAAISAKQTINQDADAYAAYENASLYQGLSDWSGYRYTKQNFQLPNNFNKQRDILFLDNVAALYRNDIFRKLNGFRAVEHAEDLDFAKRASARSYTIGFISQRKVTHSHTRPFEYILKRNYIGYKIAFQQLTHRNSVITPDVALHFQICSSLLKDIDQYSGSLFWLLLTRLRKQSPFLSNTLAPELQFMGVILSVCKPVSFDKANGLYRQYIIQLLRRYIQAKLTLSAKYLSSLKDQQIFLKKVLAAYCGENLAIVINTKLSQDDTQQWLYILDNLLKNKI